MLGSGGGLDGKRQRQQGQQGRGQQQYRENWPPEDLSQPLNKRAASRSSPLRRNAHYASSYRQDSPLRREG